MMHGSDTQAGHDDNVVSSIQSTEIHHNHAKHLFPKDALSTIVTAPKDHHLTASASNRWAVHQEHMCDLLHCPAIACVHYQLLFVHIHGGD